MIYDEKAELPHGFQVQKRIPKETGLVTSDGKLIIRNPEPIGYVAPRHYSPFSVKESK